MKKWRQREPAIPYDEKDPILKKLACMYGIDNIGEFLNPPVDHVHHYSLLKNIEEAVNLILSHISKNHEIVIFCDIDHDGALSGAITYRYLKYLHPKVKIVHKQRRDGHGLNTAEDVIDSHTNLLIAIDSSTNDVDACEKISENRTDIIIIDHHEWEGKDNPHALIVNPQMPDCKYPNKNLSGGMVAFKVCQALDDYLNLDYAEDMIDMAGLSLLADSMLALEPENRYFIDQALKRIKNIGLTILLNELKVKVNEIDSTRFVYGVSPCVSAITRMNEFEKAIGLYISDDPKECLQIAKELVSANKERKRIQKESYKLIQSQINENDNCIIVVEPSIGKEFNGLVAQLITEKYNRPSIVFGHKSDDSPQYSGSYRSPEGFSMLEFLGEVNQALFAGGHDGAGGTACWKNKLQHFKKEVNEKLSQYEFDSDLIYDLEFNIEDINEELIHSINSFFRICGRDFKPAKILIKDVFVIDKEPLGNGDTLKAQICSSSHSWFTDEDEYGDLRPEMVAMRFRIFDDFAETFPKHKSINIIGTLNVNEFQRYKPVKYLEKTKQIFIEDYQLAE